MNECPVENLHFNDMNFIWSWRMRWPDGMPMRSTAMADGMVIKFLRKPL